VAGFYAARDRIVPPLLGPNIAPPFTDRLAPKVMAFIKEGRSYRWIARDLGISKNTVLDIAKRNQNPLAQDSATIRN